jgi:myo-inositol-1(or 4)-monophosphatase
MSPPDSPALYDEQELLAVAHEAAQAAAAELVPRFGGRARGVRTKSTPTDLVSEADLTAEDAIRQVLQRRRPADAILAEEGGATESAVPDPASLRWVVDPLDGSVNFLFEIPAFAISVACESGAGAIVGLVLDPIRDECFTATLSGAAALNGQPIEAPDQRELGQAMVATGFGYDASVRERQAAAVARVLPRVRDIRRVGAAALDLVWCACGRYDAYYERGVQHWDVAAGSLIAERAGLRVRRLPPTEHDAAGIVVAPAGLIDELVGLVIGER